MKPIYKYILLLTISLSSCGIESYHHWSASSYKSFEHRIEVDSIYLKKYGQKMANFLINKGHKSEWIKDSIPFFHLVIETKNRMIPLIPIIFTIEYQGRGKYGFNLEIENFKNQLKTVDSLHYSLSNNTTNERTTGKYIFPKDILSKSEWNSTYIYQTIYSIDFKINRADIIEGDFEIFYTDINNKTKLITAKKLKFDYDNRSCYFYTAFNV